MSDDSRSCMDVREAKSRMTYDQCTLDDKEVAKKVGRYDLLSSSRPQRLELGAQNNDERTGEATSGGTDP